MNVARMREKSTKRTHDGLVKVRQRVAKGRWKQTVKIGAAGERVLQKIMGFASPALAWLYFLCP